MLRFLLGRLGQSLILLFIVSLIGFSVLLLAPGGPMSQFALTPGISKAEHEYRHVRLSGIYLHEQESLVQASTVRGAVVRCASTRIAGYRLRAPHETKRPARQPKPAKPAPVMANQTAEGQP